jgi:hypothetical protein
MSTEEFNELYQVFKNQKLPPRVRNPDPLDWAANTVHEILISVPPEVLVVGTLAVKKVGELTIKKICDWVSSAVEKKMKEREDGNVEVTIYDANNKPYCVVTRKPERPKRKV